MAGITELDDIKKLIFVETPRYSVAVNLPKRAQRYSDEQIAFAYEQFLQLESGLQKLGFLEILNDETDLALTQFGKAGRSMFLDSVAYKQGVNGYSSSILSLHLQKGVISNVSTSLAPNFELFPKYPGRIDISTPDKIGRAAIPVSSAIVAVENFIEFCAEQFIAFGVEFSVRNVKQFLRLRAATYENGQRKTDALRDKSSQVKLLKYMASGVDYRMMVTLREIAYDLDQSKGGWPTLEEIADLEDLPSSIVKSLLQTI